MKGGSPWEKLIQQRKLIPVSQMFLLMRLMYIFMAAGRCCSLSSFVN